MSGDSDEETKMDHTLDPILPADETASNEMSYLYGRDPSILAYGQRPAPSTESKKNLYSLYEVEESVEDNSAIIPEKINTQTLKVYLRLKPFLKKMNLSNAQADAYSIKNSTTLITKIPSMDITTMSTTRSSAIDVLCRKYKFTETFGPKTTQCEFFEKVIKSHMQEFLSGKNCTIMAYGTTNSGKSYTLQGKTTSPGIIPRALEYVFANIDSTTTPVYKPQYDNKEYVRLTLTEQHQELDITNKLLAFGITDKHSNADAYKKMQELLINEPPISPIEATDSYYSVWVSFAEIYNEAIFDLLSNDCQKRRPPLKLATDSQGRAYIKGLKTIYVNSGTAAFQALMAGQYNLKVAATALNARSSRSHCIFTIKLLKYNRSCDPKSVEVSTFTFCDLAGSERLKKTLNVGDRLKEAQNINTSLLVLGRCLKSIYEGQTATKNTGTEPIGPFRDSKLTRLFQTALSGKEPIALIVNVNPSPNLYTETQNVLNFAAIAKKIVVKPKKAKPRRSKTRFSHVVASQGTKNIIDWDETAELQNIPESIITEDSQIIDPEDYDELLHENENLRKQVADLKASSFKKDFEIRQELTEKYTAMMKEMELECITRVKDVEEEQENLIQWKLNKLEKHYNDKLSQLASKKRRRSDDDNDFDDSDESKLDDLKYDNDQLLIKNESLKKTLKEIRQAKELADADKNAAEYELGLAKVEVKRFKSLIKSFEIDLQSGGDSLSCIHELQEQVDELSEKNRKLKQLLDEAQNEYSYLLKENDSKDVENQELRDQVVYQSEKIRDLEGVFESTNIVLTDKTKYIENLEDKLEYQAQLYAEAEERYLQLQENKNFPANVEISKVTHDTSKDNILTELQEQLKKSEEANIELTSKLFQGFKTIEELKHDLNTTKDSYKAIKVQLQAQQAATNEQHKEPVPNIIVKTETVDYCDGECQTALPITTDQIHQTSFIDPTQEILEKLANTETKLENALLNKNNIEKLVVEGNEINLKLEKQIDDATKQINEFKDEIQRLNDAEQNQSAELMKVKEDYLKKINLLNGELNLLRQTVQDKEVEIIRLQKEVKAMLQSNVNDEKVSSDMEREMKDALQACNKAKDKLLHAEESNKILNTKVTDLEDRLRAVELLKKEIQDRNREIEEFKIETELLRQKNLEHTAFLKNRETTISKYEQEFAKLKNELEREKREVKKYQDLFLSQGVVHGTPRSKEDAKTFIIPSADKSQPRSARDKKPPKENYDSTSDDDVIPEPRGRRNKKHVEPSSPSATDVSIIEPSGSESKRPTRRAALKTVAQNQSEKKPTRKKKLFTQADESCVDLEPPEPSPPAVSSARSLRTRKRH